jgi:hypothetical protein
MWPGCCGVLAGEPRGRVAECSGALPHSRWRIALLMAASLVLHGPVAQAEGQCCKAEGHYHREGTRVESFRVTGVRTRTVIPVYVVCRGGLWIWPSNGEPVARQRRSPKDVP